MRVLWDRQINLFKTQTPHHPPPDAQEPHIERTKGTQCDTKEQDAEITVGR